MVETPDIFDRDLLALRAGRVSEDGAFLKKWAKAQMVERLEVIKRNFQTESDLQIPAKEILDVGPPRDFISSTLSLHHVNDLPGILIQIRKALKDDGLFMGALFGGETLYELREALTQTELTERGGVSPRVHPFASKQDMGALMQRAGFALPVVDSEIVTVTYENMFKLIADLRAMGETNMIAARDKRYIGRDFFMKAAQYYQEHFAEDDGRIKATFEVLFVLGWAPHESQQKPLTPGSAKNRLADALDTDETKL